MFVASQLGGIPQQEGARHEGASGSEEGDGGVEVAEPEAGEEGGQPEAEEENIETKLDTLGAEHVGDEHKRGGGERDGHPGQQEADVAADAYPFGSEEEEAKRLGPQAGDDQQGEGDGVEKEEKAADVVQHRLPVAYPFGHADVEEALENAVDEVGRAEGYGERQRVEPHLVCFEVVGKPQKGQVEGEAVDEVLRHDEEGEVAVEVCGVAQLGACEVARSRGETKTEVDVAHHAAQQGAERHAGRGEEGEGCLAEALQEAEEELECRADGGGHRFGDGDGAETAFAVEEFGEDAGGAVEVDHGRDEQREGAQHVAAAGHRVEAQQEADEGQQEETDGGIEPQGQAADGGGFAVRRGDDDGQLIFARGEDDEGLDVAEEDVVERKVLGREEAGEQEVGGQGHGLCPGVAGEEEGAVAKKLSHISPFILRATHSMLSRSRTRTRSRGRRRSSVYRVEV